MNPEINNEHIKKLQKELEGCINEWKNLQINKERCK